ncbi:ABC transporter permease [Peterkaempfera bronchialis]|uniref:ABC transporter permease n=1 Tax=Peterkaempfera bronchialis TaxID=2126346 RepID=UPI003C2EE7EF
MTALLATPVSGRSPEEPPPGLVPPLPPRRHAAARGRLAAALRAVGPLALLAGWWTASATGVLTPDVLASPPDVVRAVGELWGNGQLADALRVSLTRSGLGLLLGAGTGLLLGIVTGLSRLGDQLLDSAVQVLRTLPFLALAPLFMVWFGIDEASKVILIAVATTFPMYVNTASGVRTTDPRLLEAMRTFGLHGIALVRQVVVPAALPSVLAGLRLSMTLSVIALVAAEEINSTAGIGYLMAQAQNYARTDILALCVIIYGVLGLAADGIVRTLERLLAPWRRAGAAR